MGNGHSASPELSLVTSSHVVNPAFSNIIEAYPAQRRNFWGGIYYDDQPALLQTTFGREGPETISVVRDLDRVFRGRQPATVETLSNDVVWPNEAELVPYGAIANTDPFYTVISSQGFFPRAPGTGFIALYDVTGQRTTITKEKEGFFYHVTHFHDMNKDGRLDIVTARTRVPFVPAGPGRTRPDVPNAETELLWLEQPVDGALTEGWEEHIINRGGAGVTFDLVDMDNNGEMQIMTAEFFQGQKIAIIECTEQNWLECSGQDEDGVLFNEDKLSIVVVNEQKPALPPCSVVPAGTPCNDGSTGGPPIGGPPAGPLTGPPAGGPPCWALPFGVTAPCVEGIPQPRRFFNAELVDLNNDGQMDILATSSPHAVNGTGKMWAFEQPLSGNWRFGPWRAHILSEGPQYALNAAQNGSPGDAHTFFPCLDSHEYCKYDIELPSIILSGDDAGFISIFTPEFDANGDFNFQYSEEQITKIENPEGHTMGSPAVRYNSRGFAEFVVPKYSDNTLEFWSYDPES